jgi:hypothetical protein
MTDRYDVRVIARSSCMGPDDYHATVTRRDDGKELVFIGEWMWLLRLRLRRSALDRAFRASDRHEERIARVREFSA